MQTHPRADMHGAHLFGDLLAAHFKQLLKLIDLLFRRQEVDQLVVEQSVDLRVGSRTSQKNG